MTTGAWKLVLLGAATTLALAGCAGDPAPTGSAGTPTTSASRATPAPPSGSAGADGGKDGGKDAGKDAGGTSSGEDGADGSAAGESPEDPDGSSDGSASELEMPEEPEETVSSLSELLDDVDESPLVTSPLPRAASARGRVVPRFPAFLRPTRATTVETSSLSPSGSRLQATLTGSTTLTSQQVLLVYRTRLGGRGLSELAAPATVAGSQAAAFRRGRSVVTITVTPGRARTTYAVQATLHAGGA